jgi:hypothetical protein
MPELVERSVLVDPDTWSEVTYRAVLKGRRGTRITAGEMLREAARRKK